MKDGPPAGWSRRSWSGEEVDYVCGLAFSGGGIRSATFNLGVLQRLQELDLLRHVDYLSTVSGGGYIGAWLVGNVRRTRFWLSRLTCWEPSIAHLRRYSNYLAPHNGILKADSWAMWLTWVRNAFLIQLQSFIWLAAGLMAVLGLKGPVFDWASVNQKSPWSGPHWALGACMAPILAILMFFLARERVPRRARGYRIFRLGNALAIVAAGFAWTGCFLTAGLLWGQAANSPRTFTTFSGTLMHSVGGWSPLIVWLYPSAIALMAGVSLKRVTRERVFALIAALVLVPAVSYLAVCGQLRIFGALLTDLTASAERLEWIAFVIGPWMTMLAIATAVVLFIGLMGRGAADWTREWWTRYGAWIAMIGTASLLAIAVAVVAPWAILRATDVKWSAVSGAAAWVGSVYAGLTAGKGTQTGGRGDGSKKLEIVARVGGFLFIAGAVSLGSTLVYVVLRAALGSDDLSYARNLQQIAVTGVGGLPAIWVIVAAVAAIGAICSNRFDLNTFSLNHFYRNRLVRCYLGATRWQPGKRRPHPFTAFDDDDDLDLADLRVPAGNQRKTFCNEVFRGPFPIINCTLNLGGSSDLTVHTRQSASFSVTPLYAGATRKKVGFAPIVDGKKCFAGGVKLGEAISISGAAASPNMGYNTSPLVSFMMTLFNVRLGWWFPNPAKAGSWHRGRPPGGLIYLLSELLGLANENRKFVNASDGGHFENLGIYELIRRRARVIIASDAECDPEMTFGSLGNVVRICETDFGAEIDIDVSSIRKQKDTEKSLAHCAVGRITYSNGMRGYLIYIKSSITGDEDVGVEQYRSGHPTFPHESTGNQFYREDQFEAYRRLGHHITERTFRDADGNATTYEIASKLFDVWAPAGFSTASFLRHAQTLESIVDRFRTDGNLRDLMQELFGRAPGMGGALHPAEHCACLELIQLMENVFLDLRLDDFWEHPDNRGWALLFTGFARSEKFRASWNQNRSAFGIRFEYFCSQRLGLDRDRPVMRV
ncbi:MAG: patatin-like phospholipase family protein [Acidobacteriota bacterium]|nr:patatin-like phospholipase family protein [Acidobacteriota bacterium]